jgi:hypothetical protein
MSLRKLLIGAAILAIAVPAAAYGTTNRSSSSSVNYQKLANLYLIHQLEVKWHKAVSKKNLKLAMSIYAPNATFQIGGQTYTGKAQIRQLIAGSAPFKPENHWVSDTPAYKIRATVNGNKGTISFECDYIDVDTRQVVRVVGGDNDVRKIHGKWLIVHETGSTPTLSP